MKCAWQRDGLLGPVDVYAAPADRGGGFSRGGSGGGGQRRRDAGQGAERVPLRGGHLSAHDCMTLCTALESGQICLIPTDTGYCYIGNPDSAESHRSFLRLREAHPKHKPFSLMVPNIASVAEIAVLDTPLYRVLKKILPGPYTLILKKNKRTPETATSQRGVTVGIRIPDVPHLQELLASWDKPLLVTSVTDAEELITQDYYRDAETPDAWWAYGEEIMARHGHEIAIWVDPQEPQPMRVSTIFDVTVEPPLMLRDGGWDLSELTFDFVRREDAKD